MICRCSTGVFDEVHVLVRIRCSCLVIIDATDLYGGGLKILICYYGMSAKQHDGSASVDLRIAAAMHKRCEEARNVVMTYIVKRPTLRHSYWCGRIHNRRSRASLGRWADVGGS